MFFIFKHYNIIKKRSKIFIIIFIALFSFLAIRLYFVQDKYNKVVTNSDANNSINKENISDYNYLLLDRNGKDLNTYKRKYKVFINGKTFALNGRNQNLDSVVTLNYILSEEIKDFSMDKILSNKANVTYEITEEAFEKIEDIKGLKGIYVYEYDELTKKKDLSIESTIMESKGYNIFKQEDNYHKSKESLEGQINEYVENNINTKEVFEKDVDGIYSNERYELNKDNNNIRLTLDSDYQKIVREVLQREEYSEFSNIGVAITEGDTGKILAMAQKDESKPNILTGAGGISGYEPGSTFKILTLEAAMKYLNTSLGDVYLCNGTICKKDRIHGKITVEKAMEVSCNDVFVTLGSKIGIDKLTEFAKEQGYFDYVLGLDKNTGMEAKGSLPSAGSTAGITAIGQTILATPIQILGTLSTVVNDGVYVKPYMLEAVENQEGKVIKKFEGERKEVINKNEAKTVKNLLAKATNDGSAIKAKINGVEIGGKTGTAEGHISTHGSFLGYFKLKDKYYNMIVFLPNMPEEDRNGEKTGGGNTAAPIFKEIVLELIKNK